MKKLFLLTLLSLVGVSLGIEQMLAQAKSTEDVIIITPINYTTDPEAPVSLSLYLRGEGEITLEGTSDKYGKDKYSYVLTGEKLLIKGKVTSIECNYSSNLTAIDCSQSKSIESIKAKYGSLSQLNVAGCKSLKHLETPTCKLTSLDLTGCENLEKLLISGNMNLKKLELKGCTALKEAELQNCSIETLDLTGLLNLTSLQLQKNSFSTLSLKGLNKLKSLDCSETEISSLDLSDCKALNLLTISGNKKLTDLTLPQAPSLEYLYMQGNALAKVDLANLSALKEAYLERNKLTDLRIENCPKLKVLGLHLNAFAEEATKKIVEALPDYGKEDGTTTGKLFAKGEKIDYKEANIWSAYAISLAQRKGWGLYKKNENSYDVPSLIYSFAKVTLAPSANGLLAIQGFDNEALKALPQDFEYTLVVTPNAGYKIKEVKLNDEVITDYTFTLSGDTKIEATFVEAGAVAYDYYLTGITNNKNHNALKNYTYGYDENKRWISRTEKEVTGKTTMKNQIRYNEKGQISEIDFTFSLDIDKDGKPSQTALYEYNEYGLLVSRKMNLYGNLLADCKISYRADGKRDFWYDSKGDLAHQYIYDAKGQLVEEKEGAPEDPTALHPNISSPMGKIVYSYNPKGKLETMKVSARSSNWLYIKGLRYHWNDKNQLAKIVANNFDYTEGETDPEKGTEMPMFELRYIYDETNPNAKIFWPQMPFTEANGGDFEFPYILDGYCNKAEYWGLSTGNPTHTLDIVYTFDASPKQLEKLKALGKAMARYTNGSIVIEGEAIYGIRVVDMLGNSCLEHRSERCQRMEVAVALPRGIYLVQLFTENGMETIKIALP